MSTELTLCQIASTEDTHTCDIVFSPPLGTVAEVKKALNKNSERFGEVDEKFSQIQKELCILQLSISNYVRSQSKVLNAGDLNSVICDVQKLTQVFKNKGWS